jgi:hypothetical protein
MNTVEDRYFVQPLSTKCWLFHHYFEYFDHNRTIFCNIDVSGWPFVQNHNPRPMYIRLIETFSDFRIFTKFCQQIGVSNIRQYEERELKTQQVSFEIFSKQFQDLKFASS